MTRASILLTLAFALFSFGSAAHAGKPCPWNDKHQPEKSKLCRLGTIHQCEDGQWVSLGTKCSSSGTRFQDDEHASVSSVHQLLGASRTRRDTIVARIAPQS